MSQKPLRFSWLEIPELDRFEWEQMEKNMENNPSNP